MPYYCFVRDDGVTEDVFFHMSDKEKVYNGENGDEQGRWKRVFVNPQVSIDTQLDPFNKNAFINTQNLKKETIGSTWDRSAELSAKRAEKCGGVDPVKQKALESYAKKRNGKRHPDELKTCMNNAQNEANKALSKLGIKFNIPTPKSRRVAN